MPAVANSIAIDLSTLFTITVFISAIGGLLLLFSWMQNRNTPALALWGTGYLFGAAGAAMLGPAGLVANSWSAGAGNALICAAYGILWSGSRSFEGRRPHPSLIFAGAALWIVAFQFAGFHDWLAARVVLVSAILSTYGLLSARELWYARDRELISRWPTLALVLLHTGFLLVRIPFAGTVTASLAAGHPHGFGATVMAFEALFATFCIPFLRMAMSKERVELEQRRAALTDPLTGVANRRAFFDFGSELLRGIAADRRSAALLVFDLDRFKEVNDTAGHHAGDCLLKAFASLVAGVMRPGDLFGRIGGEEFACLMANASMADALHTAERVRREFAAMRVAGLPAAATVSVGVAMTSDASRDLPALLATADRALYRAKADGRNRVAPAPLILVEKSGRETARRAIDVGRAPAVVEPIAG